MTSRNIYREKRGLTCKSLVLLGVLLLSNVETDRGFLGQKGHVIIYKTFFKLSKLGLSRKSIKKVSNIRFMCNINYM